MDMGPRSRCRRKTLTTHKSGFQPLFSSPALFSYRRRQSGCSEASEIVGPAAKVAVTVPVDSCRFFPADPLLPSPAACLLASSHTLPMPGPRALCSRMSTRSSGRAEVRPRHCPAPCPEKETVGFICQHACPPRHLRLFYELCAYIKSGSPPEGLLPPRPAHSPPPRRSAVGRSTY
jgi:hypothetical protein